MVAGILDRVQPALKVSQRVIQNRRAMRGASKTRSCFLLSPLMGALGPRIVFRNRPLVLCQYIHAETLLGVQMRVSTRTPVHANQHQHGIERNRGERVGGHTVHFILEIHRDNGHASRKASHRLAELGLCDAHFGNSNHCARPTLIASTTT